MLANFRFWLVFVSDVVGSSEICFLLIFYFFDKSFHLKLIECFINRLEFLRLLKFVLGVNRTSFLLLHDTISDVIY